jgi:lactate dehydrogenase-like 2-hydroxyacid dehydrogenase
LYEYFNRYAGEEQIIMSFNKPIRRIAVVGTGLIGSSWAALYLARGFDVIATNPHPNAESKLRHSIDLAWDDLTVIGLSRGATRDRLSFTSNIREALLEADFVQENDLNIQISRSSCFQRWTTQPLLIRSSPQVHHG